MANTVKAKLGVCLKIGDDEYIINEGDIITDLVCKVGKVEKVLTGAVRVICATTKTYSAGPQDCPPEPYIHKYITPTMFVVDSSDENHAILNRVNISDIQGIGSVDTPAADDVIIVGSGPQYKNLNDVIADAPDGAVIKLQAGEYADTLELNKNVILIGDGGAVITGPIVISGNAPAVQDGETTPVVPEKINVQIENLKLTGNATINVGDNVERFWMTDCVFGGHTLDKKTMPIKLSSEEPIEVCIVNNTFEDQNEFSYNLIEVYGYLKDGSSITGNTFSEKSCTHNQISLYNVEDNATIYINENHAVRSVNMIRIGFKGSPKCTVKMDGNSYDYTDEDPRWAGLFLVQPYSTKTVTFEGVKIEVNDTVRPADTQLGYVYAGAKDTQWTDTNKPTVLVNGVQVAIPDITKT